MADRQELLRNALSFLSDPSVGARRCIELSHGTMDDLIVFVDSKPPINTANILS